MGFLSDAFKSKEQAALEAALGALTGSFTSMSAETLNKNVDTLVAAYTDKAADKISGNLDAEAKTLLDIARNAKKAQDQLSASSPQENEFLSAFSNVLARRTSEATSVVFQASNHLARVLSAAESATGPKTLMQTRALEKLSDAYITYSNYWGGPNGDGGSAGIGNWNAGITTAFAAARGYKSLGRTEDSARVYGTIVKEAYANAIALKEDFAREAQAGVDAGKPAAKAQQYKM